jgi:hypothetical protein
MADEIGIEQHGLIFVLKHIAMFFENDSVESESACLVSAQDVHGAEVLDRVEAFDDDFLSMAPLERQTETIIGSISGVNPTATESAKKNAPRQSCLVRPLMRNTSGTMTNMKRIMSHVNRLTPLSKLVSVCWPMMDLAMPPK